MRLAIGLSAGEANRMTRKRMSTLRVWLADAICLQGAISGLRRYAVIGVALASLVPTLSFGDPESPDEAYLDALRGPWIMTGTLGGKPIKYDAVGERVLSNAWLKLHMVDAAKPPQYQADVFLSYDRKAGDFIVHWLDQFGGGGARALAMGHRDAERLVVVFPYAEGAFRDTFQRDAHAESWTLLLEMQGKNDSWLTFASYTLTRPKRRLYPTG